jgi:hypothetical protein
MAVEIREAVLISVDNLHPNEWNPNAQSDETFNQLVDEIKEDGFEQPLNVVPCAKNGDGHYVIIGGEHRWKAARVLGLSEVPCYVHEDWDEAKQKLKTVRRNLMTGTLDDVKFTAMVKDLETRFEIDPQELPKLLGFDDEREFAKHYVEEKESADRSFIDALLSEAKKESHAVDAVVDIVSNIFSEAGDTIDQNFLHFAFKGSVQTVILCDEACNSSVKSMIGNLKKTGGTATSFITDAIDAKLEDHE